MTSNRQHTILTKLVLTFDPELGSQQYIWDGPACFTVSPSLRHPQGKLWPDQLLFDLLVGLAYNNHQGKLCHVIDTKVFCDAVL